MHTTLSPLPIIFSDSSLKRPATLAAPAGSLHIPSLLAIYFITFSISLSETLIKRLFDSFIAFIALGRLTGLPILIAVAKVSELSMKMDAFNPFQNASANGAAPSA